MGENIFFDRVVARLRDEYPTRYDFKPDERRDFHFVQYIERDGDFVEVEVYNDEVIVRWSFGKPLEEHVRSTVRFKRRFVPDDDKLLEMIVKAAA